MNPTQKQAYLTKSCGVLTIQYFNIWRGAKTFDVKTSRTRFQMLSPKAMPFIRLTRNQLKMTGF
jgi:hypothetical protein